MVLAENPVGKRPHGRSRRRWEDVVKRGVESLGGGPDWKAETADRKLGEMVVR